VGAREYQWGVQKFRATGWTPRGKNVLAASFQTKKREEKSNEKEKSPENWKKQGDGIRNSAAFNKRADLDRRSTPETKRPKKGKAAPPFR